MTLQRLPGGTGLSPYDLGEALFDRNTSLGEAFVASIGEGAFDSPVLHDVFYGAVPPAVFGDADVPGVIEGRLDLIRQAYGRDPTEAERAAVERQVANAVERQRAVWGEPLSAEQWRASPSFRPDIPYQPGMTAARAEVLARQHDETIARQWAIEQHEGVGFGVSTVTLFAGTVLGSIADPTNYIPVAGPALRAAAIARLGAVGGRAAIGAFEGAVGTAMVEPIVMQNRAAIGQAMSWADVTLDIAIGALAGSAFNTASGLLHRIGENRTQRRLAQNQGALTNLRTAEEGLAKLEIAARQLDAGELVNVPGASRAARDEMLAGLSLEDRIRFVQAERDTALGAAEVELRRLIGGGGRAPASGLAVNAVELQAVRGASLRQRAAAYQQLDRGRADREAQRVIAEPERAGRQTVRQTDRGAGAATAEAERVAGALREAGVRPTGAARAAAPLTPLERMALYDPSPRVRRLARTEVERRLSESGGTVTPRRKPSRPGGMPAGERRSQQQSAAPASIDPAGARTPDTGDPAADIDATAEVQRLAKAADDPDFPEAAEFDAMVANDELTATERAAIEAADADVAKAAKAAEAYDAAASCIMRAA